MTTVEVRFPTSASRLVGRECPNPDCLGYFQIKPGTGLSGPNLPCHCPYCGHTASHDESRTQDQLKLLRSKVASHAVELITEGFERMERSLGHPRDVRFKANRVHTLTHRYSEKELETEVTCKECTLVYAVYGVFAFCPDCGQHNSLQMLVNNIDIVNRTLDWAAGLDAELGPKQVENALEDCVSTFDGFGRELCRVHSVKCSDPSKIEKLSFQNLDKARQNVLNLFGMDIAAGAAANEWAIAVGAFQKRHLIAHRMGVIDAEYVQRSGDAQAVVGRKVCVSEAEVRQLGEIVVTLARYVHAQIARP